MLHSKFEEDSGKAKDVIKQVEFESSKIKKTLVSRSSLKHLM